MCTATYSYNQIQSITTITNTFYLDIHTTHINKKQNVHMNKDGYVGIYRTIVNIASAK